MLESTPGTCRCCGCTDARACVTDGMPCHWADAAHTVCSACVMPWPFDLRRLVQPRSADAELGQGPEPILDALSLAAEPWKLQPVWVALRASGEVEIPHKAEAEIAAALHLCVSLALRHGPAWRTAMGSRLEELVAAAKARQFDPGGAAA